MSIKARVICLPVAAPRAATAGGAAHAVGTEGLRRAVAFCEMTYGTHTAVHCTQAAVYCKPESTGPGPWYKIARAPAAPSSFGPHGGPV